MIESAHDSPTPDPEAPVSRGQSEPVPRSPRGSSLSTAQWGIFILASLYTLYFARAFILPIVIALLLALALHPSIQFLQKFKIPKAVGAALMLILTLLVIGFSVSRIYEPALNWLAKAPSSLSEVQYRMREWIRPVQEVSEAAKEVQKLADGESDAGNEKVAIERPSLKDALLEGTQNLISYTVVILFLLYFLLASGDTLLMNWIDTLFRPRDSRVSSTIIQQTERYISKYLLTVTVINIGLGLVIGGIMSLLGMPSPFLWGAMATIFNFIPYVGALAGTAVVAVVAILSLEPVSRAVWIPVAYLLTSGLEGLLITPMILGRSFTLNPVIILIWLIFMGWIWGIPGALLAVPTLTILKIVCDHSRTLEPVGRVIGRRESPGKGSLNP